MKMNAGITIPNKNKILFVSHEWNIGGSSKSLCELVKGIRACSDIQCDVLIPRKGKAETFFVQNGIKPERRILYTNDIRSMNDRELFKSFLKTVCNALGVIGLRKFIREKQYSLVVSNSSVIGVGADVALKESVPHLYYIREFVQEGFAHEFINRKKFKADLEASDYVLYVSRAVMDKYENTYCTKHATMIYDGIQVSNYLIPDHELFQKEKLKLSFVGRIHENKGIMELLSVAAMMVGRGYRNFHMEFAGSGDSEFMRKVNEYVQEHNLGQYVAFVGFQENVKVFLSDKDIFCMNSACEGLGRVTIEAMLAGCLVLGKNSGGTAELIQDGVTGYLFDDCESQFQILAAIMDNQSKMEESRKIARQAQDWAKEEFDHVNMARKFLDFVGMSRE